MKKLIEKTISQETFDYFVKKVKDVYRGYCQLEGMVYNTDVLLWEDGSVTTNTYVGSVDYRDDNLVIAHAINGQTAKEYWESMRDFDSDVISELDKRGWFSVYEGAEKRIKTLDESDRFEADDDDLDFLFDLLEERFSDNGLEIED